jgi:hypothetical protein
MGGMGGEWWGKTREILLQRTPTFLYGNKLFRVFVTVCTIVNCDQCGDG